MPTKKQPSRPPRRKMNIQQIVFALFGIIIILSMIIGALAS